MLNSNCLSNTKDVLFSTRVTETTSSKTFSSVSSSLSWASRRAGAVLDNARELKMQKSVLNRPITVKLSFECCLDQINLAYNKIKYN